MEETCNSGMGFQGCRILDAPFLMKMDLGKYSV